MPLVFSFNDFSDGSPAILGPAPKNWSLANSFENEFNFSSLDPGEDLSGVVGSFSNLFDLRPALSFSGGGLMPILQQQQEQSGVVIQHKSDNSLDFCRRLCF